MDRDELLFLFANLFFVAMLTLAIMLLASPNTACGGSPDGAFVEETRLAAIMDTCPGTPRNARALCSRVSAVL